MLVAELVVDRLEVVEVDEQQRHRHRCLVLPREDRVQPAAQLADVVETRQHVGGRLLRAAVVAQGVCHRHRRASGKRVHREQVLVAECPAGALEAEQRRDAFVRGHRDDHRALVFGERRLARTCDLRELRVVETVRRYAVRQGLARRRCDDGKSVGRREHHAGARRAAHLQRVRDDDREHVLDVGFARDVRAHLAQLVRLRRAPHRLASLTLQLASHVSGRERNHKKKEDDAERGEAGVGVARERRRGERASDEQVDERDRHRGRDTRDGAEPYRVGDHRKKERQEVRAVESVRQVDQPNREQDVEHHRRQAELLPRLEAAKEEHRDHPGHDRPDTEHDVDRVLGLDARDRGQVDERAKNGKEDPSEHDRNALADRPALGVELLVQDLGPKFLLTLVGSDDSWDVHWNLAKPRAKLLSGGYHSHSRFELLCTLWRTK